MSFAEYIEEEQSFGALWLLASGAQSTPSVWVTIVKNVRLFPEKQGEQIRDFKVSPRSFSALLKLEVHFLSEDS